MTESNFPWKLYKNGIANITGSKKYLSYSHRKKHDTASETKSIKFFLNDD